MLEELLDDRQWKGKVTNQLENLEKIVSDISSKVETIGEKHLTSILSNRADIDKIKGMNKIQLSIMFIILGSLIGIALKLIVG